MNPHQIVALLVRLFVVGVCIIALRTGINEFLTFREFGQSTLPGFVIVVFVVTLFIAAFLWKFPMFVAHRLLPTGPETPSHEAMSPTQAYTIGFVILGILLLFWTISDLVFWLVFWYLVETGPLSSERISFGAANIAGVIATVVEFAMAMYLILGGRRIARFFIKLRYGSESNADK